MGVLENIIVGMFGNAAWDGLKKFFGRKSPAQPAGRTGVRITEKASDTTFVDCEFEGFDTGIDNQGQRTKVVRTKFK